MVLTSRDRLQGLNAPSKAFQFILESLGAIQESQARERHDQIDFSEISSDDPWRVDWENKIEILRPAGRLSVKMRGVMLRAGSRPLPGEATKVEL